MDERDIRRAYDDYRAIQGEEVLGHTSCTSGWLDRAARLGPACFISVTGMIVVSILALKDVQSLAPYAVIVLLCVAGVVASVAVQVKHAENVNKRTESPTELGATRAGARQARKAQSTKRSGQSD